MGTAFGCVIRICQVLENFPNSKLWFTKEQKQTDFFLLLFIAHIDIIIIVIKCYVNSLLYIPAKRVEIYTSQIKRPDFYSTLRLPPTI